MTAAALDRDLGVGPLVAMFDHHETRHPKLLVGRNGQSAESTYREQHLSLLLAPGDKRLWAPYTSPLQRVLSHKSIACGATLTMQVLVVRVVDPEGKRDEYNHIVSAREEWVYSPDTNATLNRIVEDMRPVTFSDAVGITLVWTVPAPFAIANEADAKCWDAYYSSVWKHIETTYKVKVDGNGGDFGTLFEGARHEPTGDPLDVAPCTLIPVPFPPAAQANEGPARAAPRPGPRGAQSGPAPGQKEEEPKRVEDVGKLLDEIALRTYTRAEKYSEAEAATFLAACSDTLPAEIPWTQYESGKEDTRNGAHRSEPFSAFGAMLAEYATRTVPKGVGRSFIGAESRNGRCRDADIEGITMLTLDCDAMGEWDRVRRVLDEAGLAYVMQRSSSHKPDKPKWHLSMPLARPWLSDKPAWRAIWRFIIGIFSGMAGLPPKPKVANEPDGDLLFGFDHTTDRIGQPIFPAAKRDKTQAPPETIVVATGHALDLDELLAQGAFDPAWRTARTAYEPREPSSVDPANGLLALAFGKAGMLGQRIERQSIHGFAVECPNERLHSSGQRFDTSTMIADPSGPAGKGYFICLHGHCGKMRPGKVLALLPPEAVDWAQGRHKEALKAAAAARKRAAAPDPSNAVQGDETGATHDHTDMRNAERLIEWHSDSIRYCSTWEKWLAYDGARWMLDIGGVQALAKSTTRRMLAEAMKALAAAQQAVEEAGDDEGAQHVAKAALAAAEADFTHAMQSQNAARLTSMLSVAQSDPRIAIRHERLDEDRWLLNVSNGTLDLRNSTLREHRREDLITALTPVAYDEHATCPLWDAFLSRAMGGGDAGTSLVSFLQRFVGYSLTGMTGEHVLVFFHGAGANGKSTFLRTIHMMLGDYATPALRGLLFRAKGERHPTELAALFGKRFVTCAEIDDGQVFDEALVKDLTGGDLIAARRMREDPWFFLPTHKLFIAGNYKPTVRGDDEGIWRRIRLVPWTVTIPEAERDAALPEKLCAELPGILRWAVVGNTAWRKTGLDAPEAVRRATKSYRDENDRAGQFLRRHLRFEPDATCARSEVRKAYEAFCEDEGDQPLGARRFWARVRDAAKAVGVDLTETTVRRSAFGVTETTGRSSVFGGTRTVDGWRGVRLLDQAEREKEAEQSRSQAAQN